MTILRLQRDQITLAQALKASGLADSGGQAKFLIRQGRASVNGTVETHPGRKLVAGDRFGIVDSTEWIVSRD
jgi:ribosome-associated protein